MSRLNLRFIILSRNSLYAGRWQSAAISQIREFPIVFTTTHLLHAMCQTTVLKSEYEIWIFSSLL